MHVFDAHWREEDAVPGFVAVADSSTLLSLDPTASNLYALLFLQFSYSLYDLSILAIVLCCESQDRFHFVRRGKQAGKEWCRSCTISGADPSQVCVGVQADEHGVRDCNLYGRNALVPNVPVGQQPLPNVIFHSLLLGLLQLDDPNLLSLLTPFFVRGKDRRHCIFRSSPDSRESSWLSEACSYRGSSDRFIIACLNPEPANSTGPAIRSVLCVAILAALMQSQLAAARHLTQRSLAPCPHTT
jgi:hypothetical protein